MISIFKNKTVLYRIPLYALVFMLISPRILAQDKQAVIKLDFSEKDSKKLITARAFDYENDSIGNPIPDLDLYFYVDRSFSPLPIGDIFNTTDENGAVTVEFPSDLPADSAGNVKIIARIKDSDDYADTEVSQVVHWGVPVVLDNPENKRSLWAASANAPIPLLILVNSLIATAWGIIFFIFYKLYRISRM